MDELLGNRYRKLFEIYGTGGNRDLVYTKGLIFEKFEGEAALLRADAALFLLVNVDHMLLRPYGEYVPDSDSRPMPVPESLGSLEACKI